MFTLNLMVCLVRRVISALRWCVRVLVTSITCVGWSPATTQTVDLHSSQTLSNISRGSAGNWEVSYIIMHHFIILKMIVILQNEMQLLNVNKRLLHI